MQAERERVSDAYLRMAADDLTVGTSGNVSIRTGGLVAITPGGVAYADLTPADVCLIDHDGTVVDGTLEPSSEVPMHDRVPTDRRHRRRAHPPGPRDRGEPAVRRAARRPLHADHPRRTGAGHPVRAFATEELAAASAEVLRDRSGVILGNHGATTIGADLDEAYTRSLYLEWCARLWCTAPVIGEPRLLSPEQMADATRRMASYGQQ